MSSFDYNAPAELFLAKPMKGSRTKYRRFARAAEAIRYAVEDYARLEPFGAHLEVGDERARRRYRRASTPKTSAKLSAATRSPSRRP